MKKTLAAAVTLAALALTACTAHPVPEVSVPASGDASPARAASPAPTPPPAEQDASLQVGDTFTLTDVGAPVDASFVVTKVTVDAACTSDWAADPANGHFVRLDVEGEVGDIPYPADILWDAVASNGTRVNGGPITAAAAACLSPQDQLPAMIESGERVHGAVVVDVPSVHGTLILNPSFYDRGLTLAY